MSVKKRLLDEISKSDPVLSDYLKDNYDNFTLAGYVNHLSKINGNAVALCHDDKNGVRREFTYQDLDLLSNKMANYLIKKGVKKGDVVALVLRNNYHFYIVSLALQKLGAITLSLQCLNKRKQYKSIFKKCNPKCLIADDYEIVVDSKTNEKAYVLNELDCACSGNEIKLCTYPKTSYSNNWGNLDDFEKESDQFESEKVSIHDLGYLFSTSGTTGEPKVVMHNYSFALSHFITGQWYGVEKGKKHYTLSGSGWGMGTWNMCAVLLHQGTAYINDYDRFNAADVINKIRDEKISTLCAPRATLVRLFDYLEHDNKKEKLKLKSVSSAGEVVDDVTREKCLEHFGVYPSEGYGMTELSLAYYDKAEGTRVNSPLYSEIKLEKDPKYEGKEIVIKGGRIGLFAGYLDYLKDSKCVLRRPQINKGEFIWHTGDEGHLDDLGNVHCDGRMGNTVKVNDKLVNMGEVEAVLLSHESVKKCVVSSRKHEKDGAEIVARVELNDNCNLDDDEMKRELQSYVKGILPNHYRPKTIIFGELAETCSGKTKRIYDTPDNNSNNSNNSNKRLVLVKRAA